jgi:endonuclease/exonuclease/phosphatase family metal-dependent hydrolase
MNCLANLFRWALGWSLTLVAATLPAADTFRIVEYNLENYLDAPAGTRPSKTEEAKAKIRANLKALRPDVLAVAEIGSTNALLELRDSLRTQEVDLPYWEHVEGFDTNIHVAVLSRFPFTARQPHTNDTYLLYGRRFQISRGFAEVDIKVNDKYSFTLIAVHLKSRRLVPEGDEAEMREQEAMILREKIEARLRANADLNLVVLGDFNDTKDTKTLRTVLGRANARNGLVDTRPAERNGDNQPSANPRYDPRNITWTHFYGKEDSYSRIDYILLSKGMAKEWVPEETYILAEANWGVASDHRPIVVTITATDQ